MMVVMAFLAFAPMFIIQLGTILGWLAIILWILFIVLNVKYFKESNVVWKLADEAKAKNLLLKDVRIRYIVWITIKK